MKRAFFLICLFVLIGSASLFAARRSIDIGGGWSVVVYTNGSYSVESDSIGICLDVTLSQSSSGRLSICVENSTQSVAKDAAQSTLEWLLVKAGVAARWAGVAASTIFMVFEPSPAY